MEKFIDDIADLPNVSKYNFERLLRVYTTEDNKFYHNLGASFNFDEQVIKEQTDVIEVVANTPWTTLSFNLYNTIQLWWVLQLLNSDKPISHCTPGPIRAFNPDFIDEFLNIVNTEKYK